MDRSCRAGAAYGGEGGEGELGSECKRDMGKEEKKMTLARWEFWEARMKECEEQGEVVREAGKAAALQMRSLREE